MNAKEQARAAAQKAATMLKGRLSPDAQPRVGLILEGEWASALKLQDACEDPLEIYSGFDELEELGKYERGVTCGALNGCWVVAVKGDLHLDEDYTREGAMAKMVRLRIEMLVAMGVDRFILTNEASGIAVDSAVGEVVMVNSFITLHLSRMPVYGNEPFVPEEALAPDWRGAAQRAASAAKTGFSLKSGDLAMARYPVTRPHDRQALRNQGATVVGKGSLPEAGVLGAFKGTASAVCLSLVTDTDRETNTRLNRRRLREVRAHLEPFLTQLVANMA